MRHDFSLEHSEGNLWWGSDFELCCCQFCIRCSLLYDRYIDIWICTHESRNCICMCESKRRKEVILIRKQNNQEIQVQDEHINIQINTNTQGWLIDKSIRERDIHTLYSLWTKLSACICLFSWTNEQKQQHQWLKKSRTGVPTIPFLFRIAYRTIDVCVDKRERRMKPRREN